MATGQASDNLIADPAKVDGGTILQPYMSEAIQRFDEENLCTATNTIDPASGLPACLPGLPKVQDAWQQLNKKRSPPQNPRVCGNCNIWIFSRLPRTATVGDLWLSDVHEAADSRAFPLIAAPAVLTLRPVTACRLCRSTGQHTDVKWRSETEFQQEHAEEMAISNFALRIRRFPPEQQFTCDYQMRYSATSARTFPCGTPQRLGHILTEQMMCAGMKTCVEELRKIAPFLHKSESGGRLQFERCIIHMWDPSKTLRCCGWPTRYTLTETTLLRVTVLILALLHQVFIGRQGMYNSGAAKGGKSPHRVDMVLNRSDQGRSHPS